MSQVKVAVVTGSNKGIGFYIAKRLCEEFDGHVYLTGKKKKTTIYCYIFSNEYAYKYDYMI